MKIVKIFGGLGNQMFQYSLYLSLKEEFPFETIKIDCSYFNGYPLHNGLELLNIFDVVLPQASFKELMHVTCPLYHYRLWQIGKRILNIRRSHYFEKYDFTIDNLAIGLSGKRYFDGYWQNESYFKKHESVIRNAYRFKNSLDIKNQEILDMIRSINNSVSIHIRRGDYLTHKLYQNICTIDYYSNAINYIRGQITNPVFFIFSDDILWCEKKLNDILIHDTITFIDWNKEGNSYKDMQLMSECKHNIIANSSFSWWGAWLNSNPHKIIVSPQKWHNTDLNINLQVDNWVLI
jgi:hypothetical protein